MIKQPAVDAKFDEDVKDKFRQIKQSQESHVLMRAIAFGLKFPELIMDIGKRVKFIQANDPSVIVARLRQFFNSRPRPWRAHLKHQKRKARAGRQYRRLQGIRRYDGQINQGKTNPNG